MADAVKIVIDLTANPAAAESLTAAFKRVQQSGKQAADGINAEFSKLGNAFKGIGAQLAGALGLAAIGYQFKKMVGDVLSSAVALDKLAQQTGMSTRELQGLREAARQANVETDAMDSALRRLTLNLGKAGNGAAAPRQAIAELGLSFDALRQMSPDAQFKIIAERLGGLKSPAQEARLGVALFSKSFQDVQPAIDAVSRQGLDPFIDKLKELGVYLSGDQIAQMKGLKDNMDDLGLKAKGVATQFLTGLVPAVDQGLSGLIKATDGISSGFTEVGKVIGNVFNGVLTVIVGVGKTIGIVVAATVESFKIVWKGAVDYVADIFEGLGKAIKLALQGHVIDATRAVAEGMKKATQDAAKASHAYLANAKTGAAALGDAWKETIDAFFGANDKTPKAKPKGQPGVDPGGLDKAKALASARYALLQTELANELALFEAQAKLRLTTEQAAWEQGKLSLKTYFADRAAIINQQYDLEIAGIKSKLAAVAALPVDKADPAASLQRQNQLLQLRGQLQVKEIQRQAELATLTVQQQQAQRQLFTDRMNAETKLALLQGNRFAAERAQLAVQLQALDLELRRAGIADSERQAALELARAQGTAKANFDQQAQGANAALSSLNVGIAAIQNRIASGQLWQLQGEQQIIALEQQRLPLLEKIGAAMTAFARESNNPDLIAQAEAFNQRLADIRTSADLAGRQMAEFKADVQDAFANGFEDFLARGINQVHSLADAFRQLGLTIAQSLQAAAAKQLTNMLMQKFASLFNKGGGDNAANLDAAATKTVAGGAAVTLGATLLGTSADKLLTAATTLMVANTAGSLGGTFAKGAAFLGGKPITAFAGGGVITAPTFFPLRNGPGLMGEKGPEAIMPLHKMWDGKLGVRAANDGAAPNVQQNVRIVNAVDPDFVTQSMASAAGEKVVMNIISRNQNLLKRTFGN